MKKRMQLSEPWHRRPNGLYVPRSYSSAEAERTAERSSIRDSVRRRAPDWVMATASVLSVGAALVSTLIASDALKAQSAAQSREIVKDQMEINAMNAERREKAEELANRRSESARKVTWWSSTADLTLNVRNASNGELYSAGFNYLKTDRSVIYVTMPSVPPCTTLSLSLLGPALQQAGISDAVPTALTFSDGEGFWTRWVGGGLEYRARTEQEVRVFTHAALSDSDSGRYTKIDGCV
ncbi:hypothetical protein [Actinoplanes sp. NPDC049265]|uniref:hypothetical protein n=1 Tax=Actinoplanes sp. NPDC049265 TaxID=3363902 RepID=UPI00371B8F4E